MAAVEKIFNDTITDRETRDKTLKWVGTRAPRPDGVDKVTGRAKFGADTYLPNMLVWQGAEKPARPCPNQVHRYVSSTRTPRCQSRGNTRRLS